MAPLLKRNKGVSWAEIILQHTGTNSGGWGGGPILSKHNKWGCLSNILRRPYQGKISGDNVSFKQQQIR